MKSALLFMLILCLVIPGFLDAEGISDECCPTTGTLTACCILKEGNLDWKKIAPGLSIHDINVGTGAEVKDDSLMLLHLRIRDADRQIIGTTSEAAPMCCGGGDDGAEDSAERMLRTNAPVQQVMGAGGMHPDLEAGLVGMKAEGRRLICMKRARAAESPLLYGKSVACAEGEDPEEAIYVEVSLIAVRPGTGGQTVRFH